MKSKMYFIRWWVVLMLINITAAEVILSPQTLWDQYGVTIAGASSETVGSVSPILNQSIGISITDDDILYIADTNNHRVVVVSLDSMSNVSIIGSGPGNSSTQLDKPYDVFGKNDSLYVLDAGNRRIQKFALNTSSPSATTRLPGLASPFYFYVDDDENIYLSNTDSHTISFFLSNSTSGRIVAGTSGIPGSNNSQLSSPYGIYVTQNKTIYITDSHNHRIVMWLWGATTGTVVAGSETNGSSLSQLTFPTQVIVDANGSMYICDSGNSRIIRWVPNSTVGVCIAACTSTRGGASTQLVGPHSLAFDRYGSLYVNDRYNNRIQKFQILSQNNLSYNRPKLCPSATWHSSAITIANASVIHASIRGIFITRNNTMYLTEQTNNRIQIWSGENLTLVRIISTGLSSSRIIFVMNNGDFFVNYNAISSRIDRWIANTTTSVATMYFNGTFYALFVDLSDYLYCATQSPDQVVKKSLNSAVNSSAIVVAGNGTAGMGDSMLNGPRGMVVDINSNLYVADCRNHRIQLFRPGQTKGTTVPINGSNGVFLLNTPTDVALDIDGYLFIADYRSDRILGSGPQGFRCIVGCTGNSGSAADQLSLPHSFSFDSSGNLFVIDLDNVRVQKFLLASNVCDQTTTSNIVTSAPLVTSPTISPTVTSESSVYTISDRTNGQTSNYSLSAPCHSPGYIGSNCNISTLPCDILQPCQNNGTCLNSNTTISGYHCSCLPGFNRTNCEVNTQLCQSNTCWNNGTCSETSNRTFICQCAFGWHEYRCQTMISYCEKDECRNNGVCEPLFLNYTCRCLAGSYSGRHCEIISNGLVVRQTISKSFAYIAIIAMTTVAIFVVLLDVLKYCFGIDPVDRTRKELQLAKRKKRKTSPVIIRYVYIHASPLRGAK